MTSSSNDLDIDRVRQAGLDRAVAAGASHAEVRVESIRRNEGKVELQL